MDGRAMEYKFEYCPMCGESLVNKLDDDSGIVLCDQHGEIFVGDK